MSDIDLKVLRESVAAARRRRLMVLKENYAFARSLGFSSYDASFLAHYSREKIEKASKDRGEDVIQDKKLG